MASPGRPIEENLKLYDVSGAAAETDNHYHAGWAMAGNTPFRYFKQTTHNGGTADPMIVHWPKGIRAKGELRTQYHHIIDIAPTFLDAAAAAAARQRGRRQADAVRRRQHAATRSTTPRRRPHHPVQYYEMFGNRAIYDNGWKAVTLHGNRMPWVLAGTYDFDKDVWELYNLNEDPERGQRPGGQAPREARGAEEEVGRGGAQVQRLSAVRRRRGAGRQRHQDERRAEEHLYVLPARRGVHQRGALAAGEEPQPHHHRVGGDRRQDRRRDRRRRRLLRRLHAVREGQRRHLHLQRLRRELLHRSRPASR